MKFDARIGIGKWIRFYRSVVAVALLPTTEQIVKTLPRFINTILFSVVFLFCAISINPIIQRITRKIQQRNAWSVCFFKPPATRKFFPQAWNFLFPNETRISLYYSTTLFISYSFLIHRIRSFLYYIFLNRQTRIKNYSKIHVIDQRADIVETKRQERIFS